ncbi:LytTR family DNA-binding domain-containing protein [Roseococcus sp. SDR]|uniref:LytR/AlgR family response regulator transcription factor n=1 Tax=Roseococcus sp. SDR TaxID=2835532 RepID=UPI001BCE92B2|nr:LytTR family DNA-binding domain-containing protein [Roseococcus sp. SDR]MBS7789779.1 response regulator transcription factor [Roseococcus sp. SDR]MBV1845093.1 LytTR family DNA-binding domain-containing protein [Roseococcus sp. SDR]
MLRAVIVDDEPLAIRAMRRLLLAHPEVEVVETADSLETAVEAIARTRPDVVLLDIELGAGDGFGVIARLAPAPRIIFVTAHPQHAVQAFAVEAADYLLKPVRPERLAEALARVSRQLGPSAPPSGPAVELRMPSRTIFADPSEMVALRAEGDFTRVHLAAQPALLILRTLTHFEALLPSPPFLRAGRSVLLNLQRVRRVEAEGRNLAHVTLEGMEAPLQLGRIAAARLRVALAGRAG